VFPDGLHITRRRRLRSMMQRNATLRPRMAINLGFQDRADYGRALCGDGLY